MMSNLRDYQLGAIESARSELRQKKLRLMLYSPTGSGKTVLAEAFIKSAMLKEKRVVFLTNRVALNNQTSRRFYKAGIRHGILQGENTRNLDEKVLIASIKTVEKRGLPLDVSLIIIDEAHAVAGTKAYRDLIFRYNNIPVVGLSATPFSKGLGKRYKELNNEAIFQSIVVASTIKELIVAGYLVDCEIYAPEKELDLSGVKVKRNSFGELDFDEKSLADAVDKPQLIGDIVKHWMGMANNKPTVVFATNISHSKHICEQFNAVGVKAEHIDCYVDDDEREAIMKRVADGITKVICNVSILKEGWDCLDESTEVLTPSGWKGIGEFSINDDVYSFNKETGRINNSKVLDYAERYVNHGERMVTIKSQHQDIRVTEGHQFHIKNSNPISRKTSKNYLMQTGLELSSRKTEFTLPLSAEFEFTGCQLSDDEIKFVAWFMTDGGFNKPTEVAINQSQSKIQYVNEIRDLLTRLNFDFRERVRMPNGKMHFANGSPYHEFIIPRGNGNIKRNGWDKYLPYLNKNVSSLLHSMTRSQFKIFWDEMLKGDGEKSGNKSGWLWCCEKSQADAYTHMAVIRGFSSSYSTRVTKNNVNMYRVSVRDKQFITTKPKDPRAAKIALEAPSDNEKVWCIRNENSTLITRRNGKIVIIGNCPACEVMVLARPTKSLIAFIQMCGRVLRPYDGKEKALILDHSGSTLELGYPTDDLPIFLDDGTSKSSTGKIDKQKDDPKPKKCPKCSFMKPAGIHECPKCKFKPERQSEITSSDHELQKLDRNSGKEAEKKYGSKQDVYSQLLSVKNARGYSDGWVSNKYREIFGVWPRGMQDIYVEPTDVVKGFITHSNIRYIKGKEKANNVSA